MRKCYKCEEIKDFSEFYNDRTQVEGKSYICKKCRSEYSKKRRKENPEHFKEMQRRNLEKNYENIRESQRKHRIENRDRILKRRREIRELRRGELNEKERIRRKNDPNFLINNRIRYKKYYEKNKELMRPKHNAHKLVMYAIKLGVMEKKSSCEKCGNTEGRIEGHHEDYSKPLEVIWLCRPCHQRIHKKKD